MVILVPAPIAVELDASALAAEPHAVELGAVAVPCAGCPIAPAENVPQVAWAPASAGNAKFDATNAVASQSS
jgi:hypothetical protein